jgi:hypothetical protein
MVDMVDHHLPVGVEGRHAVTEAFVQRRPRRPELILRMIGRPLFHRRRHSHVA